MQRFVVRQPAGLKPFLARVLNISLRKAKQLIDTRNVFVNNQRIWIATHRLQPGDCVEVAAPNRPTSIRLPVLYEDDHLLVVNKPPLLISAQAAGSVEDRLRTERQLPDLQAIHRLDRDTSGVLLLAKDSATFNHYRQVWRTRSVAKRYLAIVLNPARFQQTEVRLPVAGRNAVSSVRVLNRTARFSLLQIDTVTGRRHQIRIHLRAIGHPIVGDKQYGAHIITDELTKKVLRQMLHCWRITLPPGLEAPQAADQLASRTQQFVAPVPADFRLLAIRLKLLKPSSPLLAPPSR